MLARVMAVLVGAVGMWSCGPSAEPSSPALVFNPCAPLVIVPAADTTDAERSEVAGAISLWNELAATRLTLAETPEAPTVPISFREGPAPFHGVYEDTTGDVVINRSLPDGAEPSVVVAHELGHAMGLVHVAPSVRASVMNPDNLAQAPTAGDAQALAALWSRCPAPSPSP